MIITPTQSTPQSLEEALQGPWFLPSPRVQLDAHTWHSTRRGFILRDDLLHPWVSGNKLRKLDGLFARWINTQVTDVVTCGGIQSAHCTAVSALARAHNINAHLLIRGQVPEVPTGNLALSMMFGQIYPQTRDDYADRGQMFDAFIKQARLPQDSTVCLPEGARCWGGLLGFIRLVGALKDLLPQQTSLVIDSGTGTSATALALGILYHDLDWHVESVCLLKNQSDKLAQESAELIAQIFASKTPWLTSRPLPITWHERVTPRRFGTIHKNDMAHCITIARETGIVLDPIYTLAAWRHCTERSPHYNTTCLIHTGGGLNIMGAIQRKAHWFKELT